MKYYIIIGISLLLISCIWYSISNVSFKQKSAIPILTVTERDILSKISNPPNNLVVEGKWGIGVYKGPIKNLNGMEIKLPRPFNFDFLRYSRVKRWEYHSVSNDKWILSFFVFNGGYISQASCYLFLRNGSMKYDFSEESLFGFKSVVKNDEDGNHQMSFRSGKNKINMKYNFKLNVYTISLDLLLKNSKDHQKKRLISKFGLKKFHEHSEELSLVFPLHNDRPAYTHKTPPLMVTPNGVLKFGEEDLTLQLKSSVVTTDYTYSKELRITTWKWANFAATLPSGKRILINLTSKERFLDKENVIYLDDRMHMVGFVQFKAPNQTNPNWEIRNINDQDIKLDLSFNPIDKLDVKKNYGVVATSFSQNIGLFSGHVSMRVGEKIEIKDVLGVVENHFAKW